MPKTLCLLPLTIVLGCTQKDAWPPKQDLLFIQGNTSLSVGQRGLRVSNGHLAEFHICNVMFNDFAITQASDVISMSVTGVAFDPANYKQATYLGPVHQYRDAADAADDVILFVRRTDGKESATITLLADRAGNFARLHHSTNGLYLRVPPDGHAPNAGPPYQGSFKFPQCACDSSVACE